MIQFFRKKMNKKGFTLVELMIVIAVLGILAAIAVPRLTGVTDLAREQADEASARAIMTDARVQVMNGTIDDNTADVLGTIYPNNTEPTPQSVTGDFVVTVAPVAGERNRFTITVTTGTDANAPSISEVVDVIN